MAILSEKARKHKVAYKVKRNKDLYEQFNVRIPREEYIALMECLKDNKMNKSEFIRWAFDMLREN